MYDTCGWEISNYEQEAESQAYEACRYTLNHWNIVERTAKKTPKKVGLFVTCWKRVGDGPIEPMHENDPVDFLVVKVQQEKESGLFVFPTSILVKKGIVSTEMKEGKRAFRVYPCWEIPSNNQAKRSQKWQLAYFCQINDKTNMEQIKGLFSAMK